MRGIAIVVLILAGLVAPGVSAREQTQEYVVGNGHVIAYTSNYQLDPDTGGNRYYVRAGETHADVTVTGGPATTFVDVRDALSNVIYSTYFCGNVASFALPAGSNSIRVFVGADASFTADANAPECGVMTPPLQGTTKIVFS